MAHNARQAPTFGPATIAIHNHGHVLGQAILLEISRQGIGLNRFGLVVIFSPGMPTMADGTAEQPG
jgi:hypothetical protein